MQPTLSMTLRFGRACGFGLDQKIPSAVISIAATLALAMCLASVPSYAESARVAVATNFALPAERIVDAFEKETGHDIVLIPGSTGKLFAQISSSAPFDAFLSADVATPERLVSDGLAIADSQFTYAVGTLVLWTADPELSLADPALALREARHVAIANPKLAPYGKAAAESLERLGLSDLVDGKIVMGENVGQTFALVQSGAAEIGFVAASSVIDFSDLKGNIWPVPATGHDAIRQDAVLLRHGSDNAAAIAFLDYLRDGFALDVIRSSGYEVTP